MSWTEVTTASPVDAPAVPLTAEDASTHAKGSASGTGRVQGSVLGPRRIAWSSRGSDLSDIVDMLAHAQRVVMVRESGRRNEQRVDVLDRAGELRQTIIGRRGPWIIDPRASMLLGSAFDRDPTAWSLADASTEPILLSTRFEGRELRDLRMHGDLLLATALEPRTLGGPPPNVLAATIRIPGYDDISPYGTLRNTTGIAEIVAGSTTHVVCGIESAGPILAADDHIYWTDWSLQPRAELELPGHPLVVSPRSDGRSWMLAVRDDEPELRLLAPGTCELALPVHAAFRDAERLLVTHDGGAIVVAPSRIQSFDASGNFLWKFAREGAPRALVDETGTTLFTHGAAIIAADPSGSCQQIWSAPAGVSRLGPIAVAGDLLLVAAGPDLFALAK